MSDSPESKFSPVFLEAIKRVAQAAQAAPDSVSSVFRQEMVALGWRERIVNLYRIKDRFDGKFRFFRPNSSQRRFIQDKSGRDVILKARQFGFTTFACLYAYDRALFDGWSTGIMSHQRERTEKIFDIVKNANEFFIKDWGHFWKPDQEANSSYKISWKDSKASITVAYDFRSLTVQFLHVSEAAFIEVDRLTNSLQSAGENGEVILESTPLGPGGVFYNQWQTWRNSGELAPYRGHFFSWFEHYPEDRDRWAALASRHPEPITEREKELQELYDLKPYHLVWRRWKLAESCNNDEEIFEKEYPSNDEDCFLSGENQVYSRAILKYQKQFIREPSHAGHLKVEGKKISYYADSKGLLKLWALPDVDAEYVIGADASEGTGKDAAVAYVLKRSTGETVAELMGHIPPPQFAEELWKLGHFYNMGWICPEINNHGHLVVEDLVRKGYSKLYKRYTIDELKNIPTTKIGFSTSVATKVPLTEAHVSACRDGKFMCRSQTLLDQMNNFVQLSNKRGNSFRREAREGEHDDCVMAVCLAWEMHRRLGDSRKSDNLLPDQLRRSKIDEDTGCFVETGRAAPRSNDPWATDSNESAPTYEEFTGYGPE